MINSHSIDDLKQYYRRQYVKHLKDLQILIAGEIELMESDPEPTCLSALQMSANNAIICGQRLTALHEIKQS